MPETVSQCNKKHLLVSSEVCSPSQSDWCTDSGKPQCSVGLLYYEGCLKNISRLPCVENEVKKIALKLDVKP